eukprot:scaffold76056_cov70-Phaeocystis_antarctica.AAC.13
MAREGGYYIKPRRFTNQGFITTPPLTSPREAVPRSVHCSASLSCGRRAATRTAATRAAQLVPRSRQRQRSRAPAPHRRSRRPP